MKRRKKKITGQKAERLVFKAVLRLPCSSQQQGFMGPAASQLWESCTTAWRSLDSFLIIKRTYWTSANIPRICYTIWSTAFKDTGGWPRLLSFSQNTVPRWIKDDGLRFLPACLPSYLQRPSWEWLENLSSGHVCGQLLSPTVLKSWIRVIGSQQIGWGRETLSRIHTPDRPETNHCGGLLFISLFV